MTLFQAFGQFAGSGGLEPEVDGLTWLGTADASGVSSVSFNNVFDSTYTNYLIEWEGVASTQLNMDLRFRTGGVDYTGGTYDWQEGTVVDTSFNAFRSVNQSQFRTGRSGAGGVSHQVMQVLTPAVATGTSVVSRSVYATNAQSFYHMGTETSSNVYDGFILFVASGNMTGYCRVYGYVEV